MTSTALSETPPDPAALRYLIALAGDAGPELARRFTQDLTATADGITEAVAAGDAAALRAATHVAIALAGTLRCDGTQELAARLHAIARAGDMAAAAPLAEPLSRALSQLALMARDAAP